MSDPQLFPALYQPALHLVYASAGLPIPSEITLTDRIPPTDDQQPVSVEWAQQDPQACLGKVSLGEYLMLITGQAAPLPADVIDQTIMVSPWGAQTKAAMRQHRTRLSLFHTGGHQDPIEQMVALYRLAGAFENEDLLGVVNINAWTAHPPADFLLPERIRQYHYDIPFNLWFGYIRFFTDHQAYWLATKGHHIFNVPDLAFFIQPGQDEDAVINLFINVFYYLYEEDVEVVAGDSLEMRGSGQKLRFTEVSELTDVLMGPSGTLVITEDSAVS